MSFSQIAAISFMSLSVTLMMVVSAHVSKDIKTTPNRANRRKKK